MKNINKSTAIGISVLFALVTTWLWYTSMNRKVSSAKAETERRVEVMTAMRDIPARTVIRPGMVRVQQVRLSECPQGAASIPNDVYGKVAMRTIAAETVLTQDALAAKGPALGMAYNLPLNMRAVAVPLDPVSGVAGFLKPGDHVDVLATYSGNGVDITRTVLQDRQLLAIGSSPVNTTQYQGANGPTVGGGQDANKAQADAPTATLAVSPEEAQKLVLAAAKARIHLALRSPDDLAPTPLNPTTTGVVFGAAALRTPAAAPAPRPVPAAAPAPAAPTPSTPVQQAHINVREVPPPPPPPKPEKETQTIVVVRGTQQTSVDVPK